MTTTQICRECGEAFSGPATLRCPYVRDDSEHGFRAQPHPTHPTKGATPMTTLQPDEITATCPRCRNYAIMTPDNGFWECGSCRANLTASQIEAEAAKHGRVIKVPAARGAASKGRASRRAKS